jgi:hypothetical protein
MWPSAALSGTMVGPHQPTAGHNESKSTRDHFLSGENPNLIPPVVVVP